MFSRAGVTLVLGVCLATVSSHAVASSTENSPTVETQQSGLVSTYVPGFFADIQPNTAFDMIARLPGFTFDPGQSARGYSETAGNVLVNGQRPATKTENLQAYLEKIPADDVAAIELIRGNVSGIDMQGHQVLVNIILKKQVKATLIANAYLKPYSDGFLGFGAQLNGAKAFDKNKVSGSLLVFREEGTDAGSGGVTVHIAGVPDTFLERVGVANPELGLTATAAFNRSGSDGQINIQGNFSHVDFKERQHGNLGRNMGLLANDFLDESDLSDKGETSVEYASHPWENGTLTELFLQSIQSERTRANSQLLGILTRFARDGFSGETIARVKYDFRGAKGIEFQTGSEADYNFLDVASKLSVASQIVGVPGGKAFVRERRTEPFGTLKLTRWKNFSAELGVRIELSNISVSGETQRSESFVFVKPRLHLTWSPWANDEIRLRIEHEVGQLNFEDFAATTDLETGVISAGNAQLRPGRDWAFELGLEHDFWKGGSIVLALTHYELQDVIDQVAIGDRSTAGNIGDGRRDTEHLVLTLPLAKLGLKHGLLNVDETWRQSRVRDPLTGQFRRISDERPQEGSVTLSDDVPAWNSTWTLSVSQGYHYARYRANEKDSYSVDSGVVASWEYKPTDALSLLFQIDNIFGSERSFSRILFAALRGSSAQTVTLHQTISRGPYFYLRLRKTF